MEQFLNRYRNLTVLLLVLFGQLLLLAWQVRGNQDARLIRIWAVTTITPVARLVETVRSHTVGFVQNYFVLMNANEDNRRLKSELDRLKLENQFLKTELSTADRARALAAFQAHTQSRMQAARIIATGTGANSKVVYIDRGTVSGVMRGMAVITPDGIVGRVLAAYPIASQVLLLTDSTFAAGVVSQKGRVHGTLKGQGHSACLVDYVQNEEKVEVGEWFYTSGDDRVFPKGMPVGIVKVVRPGRSFKEIFITPSGFQNGVEEVLVVLDGVHQQIPDAAQVPGKDTYLAPPPPASETAQPNTPAGTSATLSTDADRIRERYKAVGEAQKHVFGEGNAPDFKINPAPKPVVNPNAASAAPAAPAATGGATKPTPVQAVPR
jgi:rod shape-determining protein MreC